jgi:hypothetical protein
MLSVAKVCRWSFVVGLLFSGLWSGGAKALAADLLVADARLFPGQLWLATENGPERLLLRREATANPAFPRAAMKIGQVAAGADGKIYFASGLDGYVLHLLDDKNEVVSFEFPGQIRDLDGGGEEHTVYFSVVPTPQNGEPLADGKIYRRDLWAGQPAEVATIRQSQVGGNWWGTFAMQNGSIYLATLDTPSRLYKLTAAGPEPVFASNPARIQGLSATADGGFYFADGTGIVYRTADFQTIEPALRSSRTVTDVAARPAGAP